METEKKQKQENNKPKSKIDLSYLGPGEFGDTRSTVEAGRALGGESFPGRSNPIGSKTNVK